ncbi:hypothetical protein IKE_05785 [Bacillus cereus VD196]|uniref:Uncharacterized protein n=1 Tax=Bacillus cereus VD196 TaxID=1053243 RepID=A0A9W5PYK9_BACCE|nr:hypothetical protein IKE_05785 [Bacillus cereus VD196]
MFYEYRHKHKLIKDGDNALSIKGIILNQFIQINYLRMHLQRRCFHYKALTYH